MSKVFHSARRIGANGAPQLTPLSSAMVLALGAGIAFCPAASQAASFTVTSLNDAGAGSLRQAIADANGAAGSDTILFQAGLTGTITLTTGQLSINDSVNIQGPGAASLSVSGNNASRVFYLNNPASTIDVTISGLTITGGNASIGGGIRDIDENLTLDQVAITGNTASSDGGGLWADGFNMNLTIRDSTISGNTAADDGGGMYVEDTGGLLLIQRSVVSGNHATGGNGGGIAIYDPDHDVTIDSCTISGNTAGGDGGGMYLYSFDSGQLSILNSTISGNSAGGDGGGLALYSPDHGAVIRHSTIAGNTAAGYGGGVWVYSTYDATPFEIFNTVIANNTANYGPDLSTVEATVVLASSLVEDPALATITDNGGNLFKQDPNLGPLQDNGGSTQTHALLTGSPALDAGDDAETGGLTLDQRGAGFPRVVGTHADMGAFEFNPGSLQFSSPTYTQGEGGGSATITVTRTGGSDGAVGASFATSAGSATVADDYTTAAGSLSWASGDMADKTFSVPIIDDSLDEPDETVNLALSAPTGGATINVEGDAAVLTITDNDPVPSLGVNDISQAEGNAGTTNFTFTVTLSAASGNTVTVDYQTADGSAAFGSDYTATSGTLTFDPGVTSQTVTVAVLGDTDVEADQTFFVNLSNPTNATVADSQGMGTIQNDDVAAGIGVGDVSLAEGNAGTTNFDFTVSLAAASAGTVTVDYQTADVSALAGSDYTATSGTLTFNPGVTSQTVTVAVLGDTDVEADQTFNLNLSNPTNGTVADPTGLGTILNDDAVPAISIVDVTQSEGTSGTTIFSFAVNLSFAGTSPVTVDYQTSDGSAAAGSDYTAASGALTFNPGVMQQFVTVTVIGDTLAEGDETFNVNLTNPQNATIADGSAVGTIQNAAVAAAEPRPVPTLAEWMRMLLAALLAGAGLLGLRRNGNPV